MPSGGTFRWGRRAAGVLLIAVVSVLLLGAGDTPARFNTLGHKMMCRCGCNQVLLECNHVGCTYSETMRSELMAGLDRGDSDELILQGFVQKYGMTVLAAPPTSGFSIVAWIMPFVVLSIGVFLVVIVVRTWKGRPIAAPATVPVSSDQLDNFRRRAREETDL
jgi:cytochrome c-type biogenesis protein CcmH